MAGAIPPASWPSEKRAICLEFPDSRDWEALILGILKQLSYGYYWDKTAPNWEAARDVGLQIVLSFMDQIRCDAGAIPIEEPQCVEFPNNAPLLDWQPSNPFLDPSYIPPGYVAQAWGVVGTPPVLGYDTGDVISGLFGLPILTPALGQGLARVRIKLKGKGTVEVHIIKVIAGGLALLTWDDNPLTARFIDTGLDVLALPPESGNTDIQEVDFADDGPHHIDVTMLPKFTTEAGFAGYGGGIRKVILCGPDLDYVPKPNVDCDQEDGVALCDQIRFNGSVLEVNCCGEWVTVDGAAGAIQGGATQPPPAGPGPTPGQKKCLDGALQASGKWLLPFTVNAGDVISLTGVDGAGTDGVLLWYCASGQTFIAGGCNGDQPPAPGDPLQTVNHMRVLINVDGTYYDGFNSQVVVPSGVTDGLVYLQVNDSTLSDNSGSYRFNICVDNQSLPTFSHPFNFLANNGGFQPYPRAEVGCGGSPTSATYNSNGWNQVPCGTANTAYLNIERLVPTRHLSNVSVTFNIDQPLDINSDVELYIVSGGVETLVDQIINPGVGVHTLANSSGWDGVTSVRFRMALNDASWAGEMTAALIEGTGADPF